MALATILGFPRIGAGRELKLALEEFWHNECDEAHLLGTAKALRATHWQLQRDAGLTEIPSNDFSLYDQVLDMSALCGVVPGRFRWSGNRVDLATYFAMARGAQKDKIDVSASEMTKWFDTNYHYIVPEFMSQQNFDMTSTKPVDEFKEALALGIKTRPVLIGPITYLLLGKGAHHNNLDLLDRLLPVYEQVLQQLEKAGAEWVQMDEPALALNLSDMQHAVFAKAYDRLRRATKLKIFVASYFGSMGDNLNMALHLPIDALHFDLVRGPDQIASALGRAPSHMILSLGVVDGRNVWRNNLEKSLRLLETAAEKIGKDRLWVSASCSLLHVPYDLERETELNAELKEWLAFGKQKLHEIALLAKGLNQGRNAIFEELQDSDQAVISRLNSPHVHDKSVVANMLSHPLASAGRKTPSVMRRRQQAQRLQLPPYPTTTIGSFPQTVEIRMERADLKRGRITKEVYDKFLQEQVRNAINFQNEIGLDVLVHGEFERNDMVEYFGEQLAGFAITQAGWVQSYGSRVVKPPIIYGDVSRPKPMTIEWSRFAQSLTDKPVKGMLTGPVTILQWSFARDDQPRSATAHQIALALSDEVLDLEKNGIKIIQIDEPAFREAMPLRRTEWEDYLTWATQVFRLTTGSVADETQIHTHMCYSEFNDIITAIKDLDADVISIETSRSQMELLDAFLDYKYPNEIGPGVYDIHSPRVPSKEEIVALLEKAAMRLEEGQIWVNPDCGLKTRAWPETRASLHNMIAAAKLMRSRYAERRVIG